MPTYTFDATLYRWEARTDSWIFANLPEDAADEIEDLAPQPRRGFGAVKVEVTLGTSVWRTSAFPSQSAKTMVLPIKRAVLTKERVGEGETVSISLTTV